MPDRTGAMTLCDLHDAFKNLEAAFGVFADILAGIKCQGLGCDTSIEVPDSIREAVDWINDPQPNGGGGWPTGCPSSPCKIASDDFGHWSKEFADRTPATAVAVAHLLRHFSESEIEYMSQPTGRRGLSGGS